MTRFLLPLLGLSVQRPFLPAPQNADNMGSVAPTSTFALKEGADVFSPQDLITLARPGTGVANAPGDLVLVPVSKYSLEEKK